MPHFFVDESGNLGFVFDAGSSAFFILVLLKVDDPEKLRDFIRRLRKQQTVSEKYEFKYRRVGSRRVLRTAFFTGLSRLDFTVWALVVDKRRLSPGLAALDRIGFYGWAMGELMAAIPAQEIAGSIMVLDDPTRSSKFLDGLRVHVSRALRALGRREGFRKNHRVRRGARGSLAVRRHDRRRARRPRFRRRLVGLRANRREVRDRAASARKRKPPRLGCRADSQATIRRPLFAGEETGCPVCSAKDDKPV
ncbi:MAG: DUF3800 domain-containing protein [Chloroflexi bacterium]|nr:DUF3800 domain-containing protein [Chloroflexota bacterium]